MKKSTEICKTFSKHANSYAEAAFVQKEIGERLFERLAYLKLDIKRILDLGAGSGVLTTQLKAQYPTAEVIVLDGAWQMLTQAKRAHHPCVQADMAALPFQNNSFDMVFSNQAIHWATDIPLVFQEVHRVLKPNGCFFFSSVGPDTFKELKVAFSQVDNAAHVNPFWDMHDLGDSLLKTHFLDPVMDREDLTVHYDTLEDLLVSLKAQGVKNIHPERRQSLMGKGLWQQFKQNYQACLTEEGLAPLSYEILYGHAFKGERQEVKADGEVWIPLTSLRGI